MTAKLTRRFAKRQLTWFRREPGVHWVEGFGDDPALQKKVLARILATWRGEVRERPVSTRRAPLGAPFLE